MKKLNKQCHLSSCYRNWEQTFEQQDLDHPPYSSSSGEYYYDIVMNLFHCQCGLCAYTEMRLCSTDVYDEANWKGGRYINCNHPERPAFFGQLDHFDSRLKGNKGWLWDNFFMVETNINTKVKRSRSVDPILKPDNPDYDPYERLEYNERLHVFIANVKLPSADQVNINNIILALGINYDPVLDRRRKFINILLKEIEFGISTWDSVVVDEFPTAFEMIMRNRKEQQS
jgi:hypothetical protein